MVKEYLEKLKFLIDNIVPIDYSDLEKVKLTFQNITESIFNERCMVYLDVLEEFKYLIEIHFQDFNLYEIEFSSTSDSKQSLDELMKKLVSERFLDKKSVGINKNNIRYLKNIITCKSG